MRLHKGELVARLANTPQDLIGAQELRHLSFLAAKGRARADGRETDAFDALCRHLRIEDATGRLLATCRLLGLPAARIGASYSGQFYDLSPLARLSGQVLEVGRFCVHPAVRDPDVLRLCWAAITRLVDDERIGLLFGCTSFEGADPALHRVALAHLRQGHLAPPELRPRVKSPGAVALPAPDPSFDPRAASAAMPALLRSYLGMGGWVSDHAVPDLDLDTLHVFTAVEVARIPPARARALRALAG